MGLICLILFLAFWAIIIWVVLSYVVNFGRLPWGHPVRSAYDTLSRGIDPVLRPIRSALPPVRFGGVGLDLSPLILMLGIVILRRVVC